MNQIFSWTKYSLRNILPYQKSSYNPRQSYLFYKLSLAEEDWWKKSLNWVCLLLNIKSTASIGIKCSRGLVSFPWSPYSGHLEILCFISSWITLLEVLRRSSWDHCNLLSWSLQSVISCTPQKWGKRYLSQFPLKYC